MKFSSKVISFKELPIQKWNDLINDSAESSIFGLSWYLEIVSPNAQFILIFEEEELIAGMPFDLKEKYLLKYSLQTIFSQHTGIFIRNRAFKSTQHLYKFKQEIVETIIKNIPKNISLFQQNFSPKFDFEQAFHWHGFSISTRFTHYLDLNQSFGEFKKALSKGTKYNLKQAEKSAISIEKSTNFQEIKEILQQIARNTSEKSSVLNEVRNLTKNGKAELLIKIVESAEKNNAGKFFLAKHENKTVGYGIFLAHQEKITYLSGFTLPKFRKSGVSTKLLVHVIEDSLEKFDIFDFEGSMQKGIGEFFRSLGGVPVRYSSIVKKKFRLL